jgi:phosphohistidine phosphatase
MPTAGRATPLPSPPTVGDTAAVELYVLRHAIAADHGAYRRDADRPLTEEGIARFRKATASWAWLGVEVDVIHTSPYVRARQTAELAAEVLGAPVHESPTLGCGAAPREILDLVTQGPSAGRVMVVGHEPDLGAFVAWLTSTGGTGGVRMKKGGLAKLVVHAWRDAPQAELQWLLWPRHMVGLSHLAPRDRPGASG